MNQTIHHLLTGQLASWETARNNYAALSGVRVKELNVNGILYKVQFNPARIVSSGAKVDAKSILERKCFLCPANLPPVQKGIPFGGHYNILVNPFPIFPRHLTVPELAHTPPVSYTHLRAHETRHDLVCRLLLEKKKKHSSHQQGTETSIIYSREEK